MERSKGHPRGNLRSMGDQDPDGERWALPRGWPCDKERKVRMVPHLAVTNLLQTPTVRSLLIHIKLLLENFESHFFVQLTWMSWWTEIQCYLLPAISGQTRWGAAESFHKTEQREERMKHPGPSLQSSPASHHHDSWLLIQGEQFSPSNPSSFSEVWTSFTDQPPKWWELSMPTTRRMLPDLKT